MKHAMKALMEQGMTIADLAEHARAAFPIIQAHCLEGVSSRRLSKETADLLMARSRAMIEFLRLMESAPAKTSSDNQQRLV